MDVSLPTSKRQRKEEKPSVRQKCLRRGQDGPLCQCRRELAEQGRQRKRGGEPDEQPPCRLGDQGRHFQELEAERIELRPAQLRCQRGHLGAQRMEEDIGRGVFEQPKEVGSEGGAREAIGLQRVFAVVNEILDVAVATHKTIDLVVQTRVKKLQRNTGR